MSLTDSRIQQIIDEHGGGFSPHEFLEDRARVNPLLIREVTRFRKWHGYKTLLTSVWRESGAHAIAAADMVLYKKWKQSQPGYMELWRLATTWVFWGVGLYDDWTVDGESVIGLHVDLCEPDQRDRPLRWIRSQGTYYYQLPKNGIFYAADDGTITLDEVFV